MPPVSTRVQWLAGAVVFAAVLAVAVGCNASRGGIFSGVGGSAEAALHIDEQAQDKAILTPLNRPLKLEERFWLRLEMNEPVDADHIVVRVEYDAGAREFFELRDLRFEGVEPPWQVAAIPLALTDDGDFNIALIVNSRKVTDVKVTVEN
ncbi:MAG: hypothetical protein OXG27_00400 [Chloroflexi bacterium]|nr:hypothetical protein [Chloroflexota bacterium]